MNTRQRGGEKSNRFIFISSANESFRPWQNTILSIYLSASSTWRVFGRMT